MKGDNGVELLIHIGINTVELNGEGFTIQVKQGQRVKRGECLGCFDQSHIQERGFDTTIMCIITNAVPVTFRYGRCHSMECIGRIEE